MLDSYHNNNWKQMSNKAGNTKKRIRKSNGNNAPHDRQEDDRSRIQHDLFLAATDDVTMNAGPLCTPHSSNNNATTATTTTTASNNKKRKDPPKSAPPPPPPCPPAVIHHELFLTPPPVNKPNGIALGNVGTKPHAVAATATAVLSMNNNNNNNEEESGYYCNFSTPPTTTATTCEEAELIRRTQKLCNAWARSSKGHLTFTELLQVDVCNKEDDNNKYEEEPPVLLRSEQLPPQLHISLNADVFERTRFRMTNTGTFEQVLTIASTTATTTILPDPPEELVDEDVEIPTITTPLDKSPIANSNSRKDEEFSTMTTEKAMMVRSPLCNDKEEEDTLEWFEGSVPVYMTEDAEYLNTIQQWIRQNLEYFSAQRGDRRGISRGRVGIRCIYCRHLHAKECESYPGSFNGIYSAISQKFVLHFQQCSNLPPDKRTWYLAAVRNEENFKQPRLAKQHEGGMSNAVYSRVAAQRIGLVQIAAHDGLRFSRDLTLEPLSMESVQVIVEQQDILADQPKPRAPAKVDSTSESFLAKALGEDDSDNAFSLASDKSRCSDYFFLSIRQATICHADETDAFKRRNRTGQGSDRRKVTVGFAGLCCRWCQKKRVFPSAGDGITAAILGNLSTHFVTTCPSIPAELKAAFHSYKKFHAQQHASIQKNLRDAMVRDLWFRLRSNDRFGKDAETPTSGNDDVGVSDDDSQEEACV